MNLSEIMYIKSDSIEAKDRIDVPESEKPAVQKKALRRSIKKTKDGRYKVEEEEMNYNPDAEYLQI